MDRLCKICGQHIWATKDIQKQIEIFAQNRDKWAVDIDFANEQYKFTLADLDMDGQVELLVSHCGGTGIFSYTSFYKVIRMEN